MNKNRLKKHLIDNIYEAQLKLGYEHRPINLNYMFQTLSNLLGTDVCSANINDIFVEFQSFAMPELGTLTYREISGGICIIVPAEGTGFVHDNAPKDSFIAQFIDLVRLHGTTLDQVLALFRNWSDCVHIEDKSSSGEFDTLVYFEDGVPDNYRYCLSSEDDLDCCHIAYHRFIPEDYEAFGF